MAPHSNRQRKTAISLTRTDHERLSRLADSVMARNPDMAEELMSELDRARIVAVGKLAADVVRMGSTLRFTTDAGKGRTVTLVFPADADIAEGKVSVLTPIGAALIGLSAGQSIDWTARDGRTHRLTVEHVEAPSHPSHQGLAAEAGHAQ
ncbi:nucleoside diphosphate kinase regulator [Aquibium sp. LZ166]|uniref:Nucleoside diphosphate kinase regulator n=1 Tax=Aquibium pacificus TaxID=3153579 RepID=A0ABV3SIY6_9HYPH